MTDSYAKAGRPGRTASAGESQELVDQIERQRIANENAQKPTAQPSGEAAAGGSGYQDFANALKNMEQATKDTKEEMATMRRELIGVWR